MQHKREESLVADMARKQNTGGDVDTLNGPDAVWQTCAGKSSNDLLGLGVVEEPQCQQSLNGKAHRES